MEHRQTRKVNETYSSTHPRPSGTLSPFNSSLNILVSYPQENRTAAGLTFDTLSFTETSPKESTGNDAPRPTPHVQVASSSARYIQEATEDDVDTQPMDADLGILNLPGEASSKIDESSSVKPNAADMSTIHKINFSAVSASNIAEEVSHGNIGSSGIDGRDKTLYIKTKNKMKDARPETASSDFSTDVMVVSSPTSSVDSDATLYIEGEDDPEKSMQNNLNNLIDNNYPLESHSSEERETLDLDFFLRDEDNLEYARGEAKDSLSSEEELDVVYYNSLHYTLTLAGATQPRHTMSSQSARLAGLSSIAIPKNYGQSAVRSLSNSPRISSTASLGSLRNSINEVITEESVVRKILTPTMADTGSNGSKIGAESEQKFVEKDSENYAYTRKEKLPRDDNTSEKDLPQDGNTSEEDLESYAKTHKGNLPQDGNTSEEDLPQDGDTSEEDLPKDIKKRKRIHGREVESKIPAHLQKASKRIKRTEYNIASGINIKMTPTSKKAQLCTNCGTTYFTLWEKNPEGDSIICHDCSEGAFIVYSSMGMESDNQPSDQDQSGNEDIGHVSGKERGGGMDNVAAEIKSVVDDQNICGNIRPRQELAVDIKIKTTATLVRQINNTPESPEMIFAGMGFLITKSDQAISREQNSVDDSAEHGFDQTTITEKVRKAGGTVFENLSDVYERRKRDASQTTQARNSKSLSSQRLAPVYTIILIAPKPIRTIKYLVALALGLPRVSVTFVQDCLEQKKLLDHYQYLLSNGFSTEMGAYIGSFGLRNQNIPSDENHGVLSGITVYVNDTASKRFTTDVESVVKAAGGTILPRLCSTASSAPQDMITCDYVISEKEPTKAFLELVRKRLRVPKMEENQSEARCNPPVLPAEWVVQCLINQKIVKWEDKKCYRTWG